MAITGYKKKGRSMLDFIMFSAEVENNHITRDEFTRIRRTGTPEEIADAVERMMDAGGYDNLE